MPPKEHPDKNNDDNFDHCVEATFIYDFVDNPAQVPDTVVLLGHLGASARGDDWWRLYLSLDLKTYLEFKQKDIRRCQQAVPNQELAGTLVWLASDAQIWHIGVRSRKMDVAEYLHARHRTASPAGSDMLEGPITADGLTPTGAQVGGGWTPMITLGCPPSWWRC